MPEKETYNDEIVRLFLLGAAVWGIIGMSVGVYIAAELAWPALNFDIPWLTFSRLRPDHAFGVIFALGGSASMGTCYYVVQRTGHARLALGNLATFTFLSRHDVLLRAAAGETIAVELPVLNMGRRARPADLQRLLVFLARLFAAVHHRAYPASSVCTARL